MDTEDRDPIDMAIEQEMIITCIHVLDQSVDAEYSKEDDCYTCTKCRDDLRDKGFDGVKDSLRVIHKKCLGI